MTTEGRKVPETRPAGNSTKFKGRRVEGAGVPDGDLEWENDGGNALSRGGSPACAGVGGCICREGSITLEGPAMPGRE